MPPYRDHLVDDVLAWWMAHGPDPDHGGVLTCWDNAGTRLVSHDKYTWSQGRWAWLTAAVAQSSDRLRVDGGPYAEQSLRAARFVRDHALLPDGTTAFVTDREGTPFEPVTDGGLHTSVFADLFAALGWAGAATLDDGEGWGDLALVTLLRSAERIEDGSFRSEPYPVPAGHRSLGLPMILVGVGEQVFRATGAAEAAGVVRAAAAEIMEHHLRGDDVVEMPAGQEDTLLARHRTPGHTLEALWFLHHARDLLDGPLAAPAGLVPIAGRALRTGWDEEHGGLFRYTDVDGGQPRGAPLAGGTPSPDPYESLVRATWDTKLWWPHAEALYTTRLLSRVTDDPTMTAWADRVHEYTFATFPDGPGREWTQIRDRTGTPLEKTVALPVKDPFHVARALLLLSELEHAGPELQEEK